MTNNPVNGMRYMLRGFALLTRPGVRSYVVIPLAINLVLFALIIYFGAAELGALLERLLPDWLDWLEWLLWPIFMAAALLVMFYTFAIVGNLVAAPFNGYLALAVERALTGQNLPANGGLKAMAKEVSRSLASEVRKIAYFLLWGAPILVLFLIPIANLVAPFLWLGFGSWMLAIQYADYPMANHGLGFQQQRAILANRRLLSMGFGGAAMLALVIPIVNFLAIPASVAGATVMWVEQFANELPSHPAGQQPPMLSRH